MTLDSQSPQSQPKNRGFFPRISTPGIFSALVVFSLTLLLVPLKIWERHAYGYADYVREGIKGRLDDPSFWMLLATIYASALILYGARRLKTSSVFNGRQHRTRMQHCFDVILLICLIVGYFIAVFLTKTTFYYYRKPPLPNTLADRTAINYIQIAEGVIVCIAVILGWRFYVLGTRLVEKCALMAETELEEAAPTASALLSAGVAPFSMVVLAFTVYGSLSWLIGSGDWFGTTPWWGVVLAVAFYWIPFLVLAITVWRRLRPFYCFGSEKLWSFLNFGLWMTATPEPCKGWLYKRKQPRSESETVAQKELPEPVEEPTDP